MLGGHSLTLDVVSLSDIWWPRNIKVKREKEAHPYTSLFHLIHLNGIHVHGGCESHKIKAGNMLKYK